MLIFLIGFMGAGKTHWGRIWSARSGMDFIDLDEAIEAAEKKSISGIFKTSGENYFREKEAALLRKMQQHSNSIIACGGGTPCFHGNIQWMNEHGISIYLKTDTAVLVERLSSELQKRPLIAAIPGEQLQAYIETLLEQRVHFYEQAKYRFNSEQLMDQSIDPILNQTG